MAVHEPITGGYVYVPYEGYEYRVFYEEYLMPVLEKVLAAEREPARAGAEAGGST